MNESLSLVGNQSISAISKLPVYKALKIFSTLIPDIYIYVLLKLIILKVVINILPFLFSRSLESSGNTHDEF